MTQPKALRLADALEKWAKDYAPTEHWDEMGVESATELRRLHAANIDCMNHFNALMDERNELLNALKMAVSALERSDYIMMDSDSFDVVDVSRAAIFKATGENE